MPSIPVDSSGNWECAQDGVATLSCIPTLMQVVIFWAIAFAGIVALFLIILSGYKFINSGGDPKAVDGARKTLTYGILGFILILLSFLIIDVISFVTKVDCIKNFEFSSCVNP